MVDPVQTHHTWQSKSTQSWGSWSAPLCAADVTFGTVSLLWLIFATFLLLLKSYLGTDVSDAV